MRSSRTLWALLLVCLLVSIACVAYPVYVIRPFRAQGSSELALALSISRFRVAVTLVAAFVSVSYAIYCWRELRSRSQRRFAAAGSVALVALACLARVNIYEIMFHPIGHPTFAAASEVKLDKDEKVLAIRIGNSARAYPIRNLAYHHIANDVVDKTAIVATY